MPEQWTPRTISECLTTEFAGEWGSSPRLGGNATVLRSTDIDDEGHVNVSGGARRCIPAKQLSGKRLAPGDILLEASGGGPGKPVGRVALFLGGDADAYLSSNFFRTLRPDARVAHPPFLRWRLQHFYGSSRIWLLQQQTTGIINLKYREYLGNSVDLPPLPEQRQIAAILDTIDDAIRNTEEVVAKLKQVKQGLLHDLLTRGIDDNGELRDPERHPEQFKNSPLGLVPTIWDVLELGTIVPRAVYGISEFLDSGPGIPVLRMMNLKDGEADVSDLKFSRSKVARELLLQPGDVLFNRTNSIDHVGRTGIWRGQLAVASFASYLVRLEPAAERLRAEFLNRWLNWEATQIRIRRFATPGVHQVNINPRNLRRTSIALPVSLAEQDGVVAAMVALEERLGGEQAQLEKLRRAKRGLMEDLLTGSVRVTKLLETAAE